MDVTITFRTPSRENMHAGPTLHERTLTGVPAELAEQMASDFVERRRGPDGVDRSKLYRYDQDGEDVLVALDFTEVIAITADGA
jgi:hypothetical protein